MGILFSRSSLTRQNNIDRLLAAFVIYFINVYLTICLIKS